MTTPHSQQEVNLAAELLQGNVWKTIAKDERYLSKWEDDFIRYEAKDTSAKLSVIESFDLRIALLGAVGNLGIFRKNPVPLLEFPEFAGALKIAINSTLRDFSANLKDHVAGTIHHCLRFFSFLLSRGIYRLSDADRESCEVYKQRILQLGWWKANSYNMLLRRVLRSLSKDKKLQNRLSGRNSQNTFRTLNVEELERAIGLPIPSFAIPRWFYAMFGNIVKEQKPFQSTGKGIISPSHSSSLKVFKSINYLYFFINGIDSLRFNPFPRPTKIVDQHFGKAHAKDGRTQNLSLPTAVKIVEQSLRWLYDYGPALIEMLEQIRAKLNEFSTTRLQTTTDFSLDNIHRLSNHKFYEFQSKHKLPLEGKIKSVFSDTSLKSLVLTYQSAMFFLIAACHARRRNEIVGEHRDYGLYFGCLRQVSPDAGDYKIDVYIEKTLRDYEEYWVPELMVKAVHGLEALSQIFRPLGTIKKQYETDIELARRDKLFQSKHFTYKAFEAETFLGFDLTSACSLFLKFSEVDAKEIFGQNRNIFRRFYCIVYVNRYDNPVLAALRLHLDHSSVHETAIYGLDPHGRNPKAKAAAVLKRVRQDDADFQNTLSTVRSEHHVDKLLALLSGENVGGLYGRLVLKLVARLSNEAKFVASPTEVKAQLIAEKMERRGFEVNEKDNGICMAGKAKHTARKAHCSDGSSVHPERAGPAICSGCINLLTSEGYRKHMVSERAALLEQANDKSLPRAQRKGLLDDARDIESFLEADEHIADGNRKIVIWLVQQWSELRTQGQE